MIRRSDREERAYYRGIICMAKVLTALSGGGERRILSLMHEMHLSHRSTRRMLDRLERIGLVERIDHTAVDVRAYAWKLTARGHQAQRTWKAFYGMTRGTA